MLTRCQKEESSDNATAHYFIASPAAQEDVSSGYTVRETKPAFCRRQESRSSHQMSEFSSESPTLPSQSCILSSPSNAYSLLTFSSAFYPRTNQQFHQGLRGYRSTHSLRGPNHRHPDPGHNSRFPAACLLSSNCSNCGSYWKNI